MDIPCGKDASVHVMIQGSLMIHDLIRMVYTNMVQGLTLKEKGADEVGQPQGLVLRDLEALTSL